MKKVFVLMPLSSEFDDVYNYLIRDSLSDAGFDVVRADDILNQRNIMADIVQSISASNLIVADLSTSNPNVYYELGLAHAFGKPVILLAQNLDEVPFDLRSYRVITYSTHFQKMNAAKAEFQALIRSFKEGKVKFGSPVSDFSLLTHPQESDRDSIDQDGAYIVDADKGLFDYQEDFETGAATITAILGDVGNRFEELTPRITSTAGFLSNSQAASTKQRRKAIAELATYLEDYATWLVEENDRYRLALTRMSGGLDGMFSGEFHPEPDSRQSLSEFLAVLDGSETAAVQGRDAFTSLAAVMDSLPKIEKDFNRANRRLSEELKAMVDNIDQTIAIFSRARNAVTKLLPAS